MTVDRDHPTHADLYGQIGGLKSDVANLKEVVREVRTDVKQLVVVSEQLQGRWRAVAAIAATVGGVASWLAAKFIPKILS